MPKPKEPLTEKQSKIAVQAQLMGLTATDMSRIAYRFRMAERETEMMQLVSRLKDGLEWESLKTNDQGLPVWRITDRATTKTAIYSGCLDGKRNLYRRYRRNPAKHDLKWEVKVFENGQQVDYVQAHLFRNRDLRKRHCPEGDTNLVLIMRHFKTFVI